MLSNVFTIILQFVDNSSRHYFVLCRDSHRTHWRWGGRRYLERPSRQQERFLPVNHPPSAAGFCCDLWHGGSASFCHSMWRACCLPFEVAVVMGENTRRDVSVFLLTPVAKGTVFNCFDCTVCIRLGENVCSLEGFRFCTSFNWLVISLIVQAQSCWV